jgi:hypothetical protein
MVATTLHPIHHLNLVVLVDLVVGEEDSQHYLVDQHLVILEEQQTALHQVMGGEMMGVVDIIL